MIAPKLIVLSAPSGSGKTTIARAIMKLHKDFVFSISATTRKKRTSEMDGKDYYFLSKSDFEKKISENAFIEYENIYGDYYGSLKSQIDNAIINGHSIIFDIDVKGALQIKKFYKDKAILIFIVPPNINVLKLRLQRRNTEEEEKLQKRLARVPMEMKMQNEFDYIVHNDDLQRAIQETEKIILTHIN